ncbi:hypothetical protein HQ571_00995 [Candidatus Kuenenbacteria bacterium]|nr:hypothetical protein [Candidatus Kuenenbacteria bacterium]
MNRILKAGGTILICMAVLLAITGCTPKPEKVLQKMIKKMAEVNSYDLNVKLGVHGQFPQLTTLNLEGAKLLPGAIIFDLMGPVDLTKDLAYKLSGSAKYRLQDSEIKFVGDLLYQGNTLFLKLSEIPDLKMADLTDLKNNWYKFDFDSFALAKQITDPKETKVDEQKNKKLRKLVQKINFFEIVSDNGIDNLDGIRTYHYSIKVNKDAMDKFFHEATEIFEERKLTALEEKELDKNLENWSQITGQVWVGEKDYYLYRIELGTQVESEDSGTTRYDMALDLRDFNKKFEINEPENVREFNMAEIFMPGLDLALPEAGSGDINSVEEMLKGIEGVSDEELQKKLDELKIELDKVK